MQLIRAAIIARLTGAITYNALPVAVYDSPPQGAAVPYICLEESGQEPWDTDTSRGAKVRTRVAVDSGHKGGKEAGEIAALVRTRLHHYIASLTGADWINCEASDGGYDTTDDGATRRAVVETLVLVDNVT